MANNQINRLLEFANMQMAAEAFLLRQGEGSIGQLTQQQLFDRLVEGNTHASKFMSVQAEQFTDQYEVLAQYRNDPQLAGGAGFSGTLFKNRETGELTLSFRSTEFIDDAVRDTKATNQLEIKNLGWAFGQISEMEAWYAELHELGGLLEGKRFNVTGYSLGGHLATAFNILRHEEAQASGTPSPVISTYTFNGAGTGRILNGRRLTDLLSDFNQIRENYLASPQWNALSPSDQISIRNAAEIRVQAIELERTRVAGLTGATNSVFSNSTAPAGNQASVDYQVAAVLAGRNTVGTSNFPLPGGTNYIPSNPMFSSSFGLPEFNNMVEVVGSDGGNLGPSFVSNSGIHYGTRQEIYIEDQPLLRGAFSLQFLLGLNLLVNNPGQNNFADTHSLVLLVDSLSLMSAMETLDPDITVETAGQILAAMSNAEADSTFGTQGKAEGDSMERMLDAFRNLVLGPDQEPTLDYDQTLVGNTWHLNELREPFQNNLAELNDAINALTEEDEFGIESLVDIDPTELAGIASSPDAIAYRYALVELNPFAVVGETADETIYESHNTTGQLDLYDVTGGSSALTGEWITDRAELLGWKEFRNTENINDTSALRRQDGRPESQIYTDVDSDTLILVQGSPLDVRTAHITFGSEEDDSGADALIGGGVGDRLYGGGGNDTLQGGRGNDHLEGGSGNDAYVWNTGDGFDTILDTDGIGKLVVNGQLLTGAIQITDNDYITADEKNFFHFEGELNTGGILIINGDLEIEDFTNGDLGIALGGEGSLDEIQPTTTVFMRPFSPITASVGFGTDGADSVIETESIFVAKGGDDFLKVSNNGYAEYYAGPGNDIIVGAGLSSDGIDSAFSGEAGSDIILGGEGNEAIRGDFGNLVYSQDRFSLPTFNFDGGFTFGISDGEGFWRWTQHFPEPEFSDPPVEPFLGTYSEAFKYALGITGDTDLTTLYDDYIEGGGGNDRISGGNGADVIFGGSGDDIAIGDGFSLIPQGSIQKPQWLVDALTLLGAPGDDYIDGGLGDDMLGDDPVRVGHDSMGGSDVLIGGPGNDLLSNIDPISGNVTYSNYLDGGADNDTLSTDNRSLNGFDTLIGGLGNDVLTVGILGNADMDGGPGNDTFSVGMLGNAFIDGGTGSDSYAATFVDSSFVPGLSPGGVVISDHDDHGSDVDNLSISILSIGEVSLSITRDESHLYLGTPLLPHWLTIEDWFTGIESKIETISISDTDFGGPDQPAPQIYDIAAIESRFFTATAGPDFLWGSNASDQLAGGIGEDALFGAGGDDTLAGNEGNDTLDGGRGADIYVFSIGDGVDHIQDTGSSGADGISFGPGITPDMLVLGTDPLLVSIGETGDAIHLDGLGPTGTPISSSIEYLQFADGSALTFQQFLNGDLDAASTGTDETVGGIGGGGVGGFGDNDNFAGGVGDNALIGNVGGNSDSIVGVASVDTVRFGSDIGAARSRDSLGSNDFAFDFGTDQFSTLWQLEQGLQVGNLVFSNGAMWDAEYLRNNLRLGVQLDSRRDDNVGYGQLFGPDSNLVNSSNVHDRDQDNSKDRQERDRIAELLHAYLSERPNYDFETLDAQSKQGTQRQDILTPQEIAQRWQLVGQYSNGLSGMRDEDARQGAGEWFAFDAVSYLGGGGAGAAFGHSGSTGATRGFANLKTLRGLDEGLALLRP